MATLIHGLSFSPRRTDHVSLDGDYAVYYAQRAAKARTMAQAARDPGIRDIHLKMAREYDSKVEQSTARVVRIRSSIRA